ncbi:MAG: FAD-dependent oxidoreductase [Bacteroidales bacterium]|nr:FAD-dependent oxidoreductase [Bacteroidales bacterium]
MKNVFIIGGGPAGVSAALYTSRAGVETFIISKDKGALAKAEKIENYYGLEKPIKGSELVEIGINQAKKIGATLIDDEVIGLSYENNFVIETKNTKYNADALIIATGSSRAKPKITGLKEYEGKGVSFCAVCDAFFYRNKDVAVLGNSDYAIHEAQTLIQTSKSVTILTNGEKMLAKVPENISVDTRKIKSIEGKDEVISHILFEDMSILDLSGLFIAVGIAGSGDLARKIGAEADEKKIIIDANMCTSIPGLFAAGDCTGGLQQICKAVYEGGKAGLEAVKFLKK